MKKIIEKLEWESERDYKYRIETGKIIKIAGNLLSSIEEFAKDNDKKKLVEMKETLRKQKNRLTGLVIPEKYTKVHEYLVNCFNSYVKASDFLVEGVKIKDTVLTYKAGRYIKEGNAWIELSKIRIWESIEKATKDFNEKEVSN